MKAKQALALIRQADWGPLKTFVTAATAETAYELIKLCGEKCPPDTPLASAIDNRRDVTGLILCGGLRYGISGRHRDMGQADFTHESRIETRYYHLNIAAELLGEALKTDPRNGLAAAFLMATHINPFDKAQQAIAEAHLQEAHHVPLSGYMNLMLAHAASGAGPEAIFRLARARLGADTPCHAALVARACYEHHLSEGCAVFSPEVKTELLTLSDRLLAASGQEPAERRLAEGWLVLALSAAGLNRQAVRHLKALRGFEDPTLWKHSLLPPVVKKGLIRLSALTARPEPAPATSGYRHSAPASGAEGA